MTTANEMTANKAKANLRSLLDKVNKETGKEHSNLSDGVETLVLGYGVDKTEVFDGVIELEGEFESGEPEITDYYEEGYEAGKAQGGGGLYDTEINALLEVAPFLTKAYSIYNEGWYSYGGAIQLYEDYYNQCAIIPPWITEVEEGFFDAYTPDGCVCTAIFLSKTPPTIGWQGAWSSVGGNLSPRAIYVPDESIEEYKSTTNLAEFADLIYPLSQYKGEGYYPDEVPT